LARKNDLIVQLVAQTAHEISSSGRRYMSFLNTAAHNFKYSFRDQLLIFAQKPDATACAEIDFWNKHASWAFLPRSAFSTAFQRVARSWYSAGACGGRRMSVQTTPPLLVLVLLQFSGGFV